VVAYIIYNLPLKILARLSVLGMAISIALLVAVLFVGKDLNGARRWIGLGYFDLQPSEIVKLGFTIYLSAWLSRKRETIKSYKEVIKRHLNDDLLPFMMLMGVVCFLIVLQPDLDTAVIIALTALTVYFVSGKDAIHTLGSIFIIITALIVAAVAAVAAPYRVSRLQTFIDFWRTGDVQDKLDSGFQVWNNLIAIGTGGVFGVGFGNSRQKLFYLQNAAFTDSIFSIVAEEFGLLGSLALILAFLYFMSLGVEIARKAPDKFSSLLALGITTWIVLQAFLNIGANLALIPFGGIPLPFISYGGSSTIITLMGVGILLNIQRAGSGSSSKQRTASA
jgi:cell division protein FtsW